MFKDNTQPADDKPAKSQAKASKKRRLLSLSGIKPTTDMYGDLYSYMFRIVDLTYLYSDNFPRRHKSQTSLAGDLRHFVDESLLQVNQLVGYNPDIDPMRERMLRKLSAYLKTTNSLIEVSHRQRMIGNRQFQRWADAVTKADNLAIRLAMWYQNNPDWIEKARAKAKIRANIEAKAAAKAVSNATKETTAAATVQPTPARTARKAAKVSKVSKSTKAQAHHTGPADGQLSIMDGSHEEM